MSRYLLPTLSLLVALITPTLAQVSLKVGYLANPRQISAATAVMHDVQMANGILLEQVPLGDLFEFSVFKRARLVEP